MNSKTDNKIFDRDSPGVHIMPPLVFFGCLVLGGVLEYILPYEFPFIPRLLRIAVGLVVGGSGFIFMMAAHEKFKRVGTHVPTNRPATTFVINGAYGFSRNSMYVGASAFFLGIGTLTGSIWLLAAYLPLGLFLTLCVVPREEAYMKRKFGDQYEAYCRRVRRWL